MNVLDGPRYKFMQLGHSGHSLKMATDTLGSLLTNRSVLPICGYLGNMMQILPTLGEKWSQYFSVTLGTSTDEKALHYCPQANEN